MSSPNVDLSRRFFCRSGNRHWLANIQPLARIPLAARPLLIAIGLCLFAAAPVAHSQDAATDDQATEPATEQATGNEGQADLDEAVIQRIDADTPNKLEAVTALLQSAITKGLDDENKSFARKMLGSVQLQRSQTLAAAMMRARGRRQVELKDETLRSLEEAVSNDPTLIEAHLLIARLNLLPGGDVAAVKEATTRAIELLDEDPAEKSAALVLRALTQKDEEAKMADLNAAVETDPKNVEAYQARAALRLLNEDVEGAVTDLEFVLLEDPTNLRVASAAIGKLEEMGRTKEAEALITKMLAKKPTEGMYRMRAILYTGMGEEEKALSDLNKALAMQPNDPLALIMRAENAIIRKDLGAAKADMKAAEELAPKLKESDQWISMRAQIAIAEQRLVDAINSAKQLVDRNPEDVKRHMFLANLYAIDKRPRKAIEVYSEWLTDNPKDSNVRRQRGDILLSVGDHTAAIEDYERVVQTLGNVEEVETTDAQKTAAAGAYNNLSWVLATSPNDSVRDGKRALEYGEKAARLSDHKRAFILSTLAAAHAEAGDFENAIEWSSKAVELASDADDANHSQLEQLQEELEFYKEGKPWREKQETEENTVPILDPEDLIDT
jgi:tetratricopeptide (TPR) repeat protein